MLQAMTFDRKDMIDRVRRMGNCDPRFPGKMNLLFPVIPIPPLIGGEKLFTKFNLIVADFRFLPRDQHGNE